jgi:deazaflavin-dependent oxidoreductase (nitroreductase family)
MSEPRSARESAADSRGPVADSRGSAADVDRATIEEFRANGGLVGGPLAGSPLGLVHHVGARSGVARVTPLVCSPWGEGRWVVVASNGGAPAHPGWCHNLRAHPRTWLEVGTGTLPVLAEEWDDATREALWPELVARHPAVGGFQAGTARRIPVFWLTRLDRSHQPRR